MTSPISQPVDVYFNLHKRKFSIRLRSTGRVVAHARHVEFANGAAFVVSEAGRQRVLRERKKNVHAFIRGTLTAYSDDVQQDLPPFPYGPVSYNPYRGDTFYSKATGHPVEVSDHVTAIAPENSAPTIWA